MVPEAMADQLQIGTMVRVALHGRRVGGWVVGLADEPATDRPLQPIAKVRGLGPAPELVDLAAWAAWRWAGRRPTFLRTASPETAVRGLPPAAPASPPVAAPVADDLAVEAFG